MEQTTTIKQKRRVVAAVTLAPEFQERVAELARVREWSIAQTGGFLIKLGLEKLKEMADQQPAQQSTAATN